VHHIALNLINGLPSSWLSALSAFPANTSFSKLDGREPLFLLNAGSGVFVRRVRRLHLSILFRQPQGRTTLRVERSGLHPLQIRSVGCAIVTMWQKFSGLASLDGEGGGLLWEFAAALALERDRCLLRDVIKALFQIASADRVLRERKAVVCGAVSRFRISDSEYRCAEATIPGVSEDPYRCST
jgi:hypothetical protein